VPVLRSVPDTGNRDGFRGKKDFPGNNGETGQTAMKLMRELQSLFYGLLDILAFRLTFR
jgi:hypothetical protein